MYEQKEQLNKDKEEDQKIHNWNKYLNVTVEIAMQDHKLYGPIKI